MKPSALRFHTALAALILTMFTLPNISSAEPLAVGQPAPRLTSITQTGDSIDLGQLYDRGPVLVYFYPKADTPGCTAQACNLRDNWEQLKTSGITVIGVSMDSTDDQKAFQQKYRLPFQLLADKEGAVVKAFGVPSLMGFAKRQSFLVVGGKIVWRDLSAKPSTQTQDVLAALKNAQAAPH